MTRGTTIVLVALLAALFLGGCRQDMHDQPRYEAFEKSPLFDDGRSARPQVAGTVARGELELDEHFFRGKQDGKLASEFPVLVTSEILERGRERYDIFCSACHDRAGYGEGIVVKRGMKQPSSFHVDRLREAPPGYFFDAITNGFGVMFDLADRVPPGDRWAIVAYVRALQLSQNAKPDDVPSEMRRFLEETR